MSGDLLAAEIEEENGRLDQASTKWKRIEDEV